MNSQSYDPSKITKPIQLSAAWFVTLLILEATLLTGAGRVTDPYWAAGALVVSAIAMPLLAGIAVFLLQTRYRGEQLADPYYAELLHRKEAEFRNYEPEAVSTPKAAVSAQVGAGGVVGEAASVPPSSGGVVRGASVPRRKVIYEAHRDLFLVHTWRPSTIPGQVADIVVRLFHHPDGRIPAGLVKRVEYDLGPAWGDKPIVKTNADEDFRLEISAYGSALCVATVYFADGTEPLVAYRYLDFTP